MGRALPLEPLRPGASCEQPRRASDDVRSPAPAWNRERLIKQFQRIDGSTRTEAERQVADFERTFRSANRDAAGHR